MWGDIRQSDVLSGTKVWPHLQTGLLLCAKTLICRPPQAMYDTLSSVKGHAKRTTWSFAPLALLFFIVSSYLMLFAQLCASTKSFLFLFSPGPFPQQLSNRLILLFNVVSRRMLAAFSHCTLFLAFLLGFIDTIVEWRRKWEQVKCHGTDLIDMMFCRQKKQKERWNVWVVVCKCVQ